MTDEEMADIYYRAEHAAGDTRAGRRALAAAIREQERQACIEYAERTERMYLARAQAVADDSDRIDAEAASDDEERHEMRAEGARAVAHGLRKVAHHQPKEPVAEVRRETPEQFALRAEQEATDDELRLDERALIRMVRERDAAIREAERAASEWLRPYDELRRQRISVGLAQQGLRMARAACEALGLPFEETAPVDLTERITELLSIEKQRTQTLTQGAERAGLETQWLTALEALPQPIEKPPGWTAAEAVDELVADLHEAKAQIAELEAKVPRWVPVEERLPFEGSPVLALEAGGTWPMCCVYHDGTWRNIDNGSAYDVTHWMPPLPSPPAEPEKEEP